jgi:hypothetical protein
VKLIGFIDRLPASCAQFRADTHPQSIALLLTPEKTSVLLLGEFIRHNVGAQQIFRAGCCWLNEKHRAADVLDGAV